MPSLFSPDGLIAVRVSSATVLFWLSSHLFFPRDRFPTIKQHMALFRCAVTGVMVNQLFFFKGLAITSPSHASLIMTATPILVLIISAFISRLRPGVQQWMGIVLGFAGAAWLITLSHQGEEPSQSSSLGDFFILINALSYGLYLVWVKPLVAELHPMTITKWVFLYASPFLLFWGWHDVAKVDWQHFETTDVLALAYVILFTTVLAYGLNALAIRKASPELVGSYIYFQPLLAIIISLVLGTDRLGIFTLIAGMLILIGVWLVSTRQRLMRLQ